MSRTLSRKLCSHLVQHHITLGQPGAIHLVVLSGLELVPILSGASGIYAGGTVQRHAYRREAEDIACRFGSLLVCCRHVVQSSVWAPLPASEALDDCPGSSPHSINNTLGASTTVRPPSSPQPTAHDRRCCLSGQGMFRTVYHITTDDAITHVAAIRWHPDRVRP